MMIYVVRAMADAPVGEKNDCFSSFEATPETRPLLFSLTTRWLQIYIDFSKLISHQRSFSCAYCTAAALPAALSASG